ncbi:hypothetical protein [Phenylobacterium sp.]|uniref:hypothetical protein n=1 Tax=Phenylobacterium sp. TaxID=1871053 RepID=UPI0030F47215
MSPPVFFATIGMVLGTILGVFAMRYFAIVAQARAKITEDNAYRVIAEKAVAAQAETATALDTMSVTLADLRTRLAAVEKMLKDVG